MSQQDRGLRAKAATRVEERKLPWALLAALALLALAATSLVAQQAPRQLTLDDAISLAKGNNPLYLSTQNDMSAAN